MAIYYTSNDASAGFDATAAGALPSAWANKVGSWQVGTTQPTGSHTKSFGAVTHSDGDSALLTGIASHADMQISFTQKIPGLGAGAAPMIGALLRMDAGYANGYAILIDQTGTLGSLRILVFKRIGGSFALVSAGSPISGIVFAGSDTVVLRAQIQGSSISVKLWPTRVAEPSTWQVSVTDGSITSAGYAGLYYALDGASSATMAAADVIVSDPPGISVANPGTVATGSAMVVSGAYAGQDPSGLAYRFDAASYVAAPSPTIANGGFSFVVTAPPAGSHTVSVQEMNISEVSGTSPTFTSASSSLFVTTPSGVLAGRNLVISGSYGGVAPTGLNYRFDGGSYAPASGATIGGGSYTFAVTAPGVGPHTLTVQDATNGSSTATTGSFVAAVPPNSSAISYSPYTWNVQGGSATTANAGAYFRTLFSGNTCTLMFDVSAMAAPASQIWWRIDNGPWTQASAAPTLACSVPAATSVNPDVPYHLLEVAVKSMTETQNRWNAGTSTRLVFTGLGLDAGASVLQPGDAPLRIAVFGDSITEGVRTLGESAVLDVDRNDALMGWAHRLGALLGAEVGVIGFGATGLSVGGSGNVPSLATSWSALYGGASRNFAPLPTLVVFNIGTNDGAANTVAAMVSVLNGIAAACPGVPIAVMRPFNGAQAANLQTAMAACSNPGVCHWIDTTGFFDTSQGADGLALHPSGPNNLGRIAFAVAAALRPLITGSVTPMFRGGFQRTLLG